MSPYAMKSHTLTAADADTLDRELASVRAATALGVALDLSAVTFLSSMALSRFVALDRELKSFGGRLSLLNVRPAVRRVFAVSRLETLLDVCAA